MSSKNSNLVKTMFKSFLMFLLGTFIGLLAIELSLRIFEYVYNHQPVTEKQSNEYRILALGESMTYSGDDSYPSQLERILNDNPLITKNIKVINGGELGISSRDIVINLEDNIKKYKPDTVIVMTGINTDDIVTYDQWANVDNNGVNSKIKVFKLFEYLYQNFKINTKNKVINQNNIMVSKTENNIEDILAQITEFNQIKLKEEKHSLSQKEIELYEKIDNSSEKDSEYMKLAIYYEQKNMQQLMLSNILKAIAINPRNSGPYQRLSVIVSDFVPETQRELIIQKSISLEPHNVSGYVTLANLYENSQDKEMQTKVLATYENGIKNNPESYELWFNLGEYYFRTGKLNESEDALIKSLEYAPKQDDKQSATYQLLSKIYQEQNRIDESVSTLELASSSATILKENYHTIAKILERYKIPLVAMQYPMRDINVLKNMLSDLDVVFVDNKKSFEDAVKKEGIEKIFIDLFAGDFGHCTPEGNRIIANNVAAVVIKIIENDNN